MSYSSSNSSTSPPAKASGETDFSEPVIFRAAGAKRFAMPLVEVGIATSLTVIFMAQGGPTRFRDENGVLAAIIAIVFLLIIWTATVFHLCGVWRYRVCLDETGITLQNGIQCRQVRWDEMFIAQWRAHRTGHEDGEMHTSWKMEIRDAAGTVLMNLNGDLLETEDRRLLTRLITARIEQERLRWLQRDDE